MNDTDPRADGLFDSYIDALRRRTDVLFAALLIFQFVAVVAAALLITPRTWAGAQSDVHVHVWAAASLGALLTTFPLILIARGRGKPSTRHTIAVAQMLYSALLIHVTGGRIETHFHVFGSLAFLAFYLDWTVLLPATAVVFVDHLLRGIFWPESVFGVLVASPWRAFEHVGWVIFEDVFLTVSCVQGVRQLRAIAASRANLERAKEHVEQKVRDRTRELEESARALQTSQERYELAVRGSRDGIWDWDLAADTIYFAPQWKELLGCEDQDLTDSPREWFKRIASNNLAQFHAGITRFVESTDERLDIEVEMQHADAERRWMLCRAAALRDSRHKAVRLTGVISDITELKDAQERLRRMAQHDRLTDLPNRDLLMERIQTAIFRARRDPEHHFAVLYFDFDRFKLVNDSLGHAAGDALLVSIANRLRTTIRTGDTAARLGGDEFVVLLDRVAGTPEAERACERFLKAFADPHDLSGHEIVCTASIGLVVSDLGYDEPDDVIRAADAAMYLAKSTGRARYKLFDNRMLAEARRRLDLERDLHKCLANGELTLAYQPILSLEDRRIVAFEALLRWVHPTLGVLSPHAFMPVAEETGMIVQIGQWVLREACARLREWRDRCPEDRPIFMNVNLSRRQALQPDLADSVRRALEQSGLEPRNLILELSESTMMDDRSSILPVMRSLREMGVSLAMDDFGTGHSSLSCLHTFPISFLKIDRDFVVNMEQHRTFSAVVHAIVALASHLDMQVIAEGVENAGQLAQLLAMECGWAQGYFFAPPLSAREASSILDRGLTLPAAA